MSSSTRIIRLKAALAAFALVIAACSSGDDSTSIENTSSTQAEMTTTSEATQADTSRAAAAGDRAPLTGLPIEDVQNLDRPALAVKIDNHPNARPQTALDQADLVFEARAEGVTRFMAVFHSQAPAPLGPVRSSRTSDFDLLRGLDTPLYSSSGGNDYVANGLRSLPIIEVTAMSQLKYFRDGSRPAPHNLFTNAEDLFALAPADAGPPDPWFEYRVDGEDVDSATAEPVEGPITVRYRGSPVVTHTWNSDVGGWSRTQDSRPHTSVAGDQLAPENVVIMVATYVTSAADSASPELVSVGGGEVFVLTDGHLISGTWSRETASDKPVLLDADGDVIKLTPGRTWILFPETGQVTLPGS
ncbi:MAG: hypothetical protein ACI8TP_000219 [Acidimicrobiales bacterium]|jgi:hypothetical protein